MNYGLVGSGFGVLKQFSVTMRFCHGWGAGILVVRERPGLNVTDFSD